MALRRPLGFDLLSLSAGILRCHKYSYFLQFFHFSHMSGLTSASGAYKHQQASTKILKSPVEWSERKLQLGWGGKCGKSKKRRKSLLCHVNILVPRYNLWHPYSFFFICKPQALGAFTIIMPHTYLQNISAEQNSTFFLLSVCTIRSQATP